MSDRESILALFQKPKAQRTAADVRRLRTEGAVFGGCCDRFTNNQGCDCLEKAVSREAFAVPESQAPERGPQVNETAVEFLKAELVRVQNERDAAQANERHQLRIVAELRQQVGALMSCVIHSAKAANNGEYLDCEAYEDIINHVRASETRIFEINKTRAVV